MGRYHPLTLSLATGKLLGPYEIGSLLGAGGMGEVYRARDSRLDRTVAIKVLISARASEQLRARFEREARAISALSHPNICALYDVGHEGDIEYLVMEYLEGETLADRIARGPLPLSHVLRYGAQIAEALQQAHRAGITHRDLKPGNLMITSTGVKLLDFGLAKLVEPPIVSTIDQQAATTKINPLSTSGTVIGTLPYMSPEQIEGAPPDHRTDIFSLGIVLYEMVTGTRPFQGTSPASAMAATLSADPAPVRSLQPAAPPALERIILTALEKNPDERWQTAQDVARQLRWLGESSTSAEQPASSPKQRRLSLALVIALTALLASLLSIGAMRLLAPRPTKAANAHLHLTPPSDVEILRSFDTNMFAISPDGRAFCFAGESGGTTALFLRPIDSFDVKKIEGSEDASGQFWSSDGEWIAFSARGKLWKVRISGSGPPVRSATRHLPDRSVHGEAGRFFSPALVAATGERSSASLIREERLSPSPRSSQANGAIRGRGCCRTASIFSLSRWRLILSNISSSWVRFAHRSVPFSSVTSRRRVWWERTS